MRRQRRRERASGGTATASLSEADFLLRVNDTARLGALRFAESEGCVFQTPDGVAPIPLGGAPLVVLRRALRTLSDETC